MAWVYILQSQVNNRYYVGSTIDLENRLLEHNLGLSTYTKLTRPFKVMFSQEYKTLTEAKKIEIKLKKLKIRKIIQKIIKDGSIKMTA